jgi:hypothetical protein
MADVSVATTRRALQIIRKTWTGSSPCNPFDATCTLEEAELPNVRFDHFAFRFVQAHALKRHRKSNRS